MTTTEHDLRRSLDRLTADLRGGIDGGRLHERIRTRIRLRRGIAAAAVVAVAATPGVAVVLPLGHQRDHTPQAAAIGDAPSWVPGYATVHERRYTYALDQEESTPVEFTFMLGSPDDRLKITTREDVKSVVFCHLAVNGTQIRLQWDPRLGSRGGNCAPPVTRQVFRTQLASYGDLSWDAPEHFRDQPLSPLSVLHMLDREWIDLGVRPGDPVTVAFDVYYSPVHPSAGPEHVTGDVSVGLYRPV